MKIFATCTFFVIKAQTLISIGKNYDVPSLCYGLIFWSPAGLKSILIKPYDEPVEWTSKYGNNIFNQVERDFPASGLNEKGLVQNKQSFGIQYIQTETTGKKLKNSNCYNTFQAFVQTLPKLMNVLKM